MKEGTKILKEKERNILQNAGYSGTSLKFNGMVSITGIAKRQEIHHAPMLSILHMPSMIS